MAWVMLFIAGLLEVGWAVGFRYTHGFTRLWPTLGTAAALVGSMAFLGLAVWTLPLSTVYAVWTESVVAGSESPPADLSPPQT